jgi:hypothetical protein
MAWQDTPWQELWTRTTLAPNSGPLTPAAEHCQWCVGCLQSAICFTVFGGLATLGAALGLIPATINLIAGRVGVQSCTPLCPQLLTKPSWLYPRGGGTLPATCSPPGNPWHTSLWSPPHQCMWPQTLHCAAPPRPPRPPRCCRPCQLVPVS